MQVYATNAIDDDNGIVLPPLALQKMAIYRHRIWDNEDVLVTLGDKSSNKPISDLSLSSLRGVTCDYDQEKKAMQYFFSRPRYISKGDVLCMPLLPPQPSSTESEKEIESEEETRKDTNPRSNVSSPLFENGGVIEMSFMWYVVISTGYSNNKCGCTSPKNTKVTVCNHATRPALMPDVTFASRLAFAEITMASVSETGAAECTMLPGTVYERVLLQDAASQAIMRVKAGRFTGLGFMSRVSADNSIDSDKVCDADTTCSRVLLPWRCAPTILCVLLVVQ